MNNTFAQIETFAHRVIDGIANIVKAIATLVCLFASISYELGQKARVIVNNYTEDNGRETYNEVKALMACEVREEEYNVLDSEYEVIVTPAPQEQQDIWEEVTAEFCKLDDKIREVNTLQTLSQQLLPAGENYEEILAEEETVEITEIDGKPVSYEKTGRGRCKKGYRRIGNSCVLISYLEMKELAHA